MNKHTLINKIPRVLLWSTLLFAFFFNNAFARFSYSWGVFV